MKSKAHIREILIYLLAWLVIPLLLVALVEFGCSYFGAESEIKSSAPDSLRHLSTFVPASNSKRV